MKFLLLFLTAVNGLSAWHCETDLSDRRSAQVERRMRNTYLPYENHLPAVWETLTWHVTVPTSQQQAPLFVFWLSSVSRPCLCHSTDFLTRERSDTPTKGLSLCLLTHWLIFWVSLLLFSLLRSGLEPPPHFLPENVPPSSFYVLTHWSLGSLCLQGILGNPPSVDKGSGRAAAPGHSGAAPVIGIRREQHWQGSMHDRFSWRERYDQGLTHQPELPRSCLRWVNTKTIRNEELENSIAIHRILQVSSKIITLYL